MFSLEQIEEHLENPRVDDICKSCLQNQIEKYKTFVDKEGQPAEGFQIRCNLIPKNGEYIDRDNPKVAQFSQEELEELETNLDPVRWGKKYVRLDTGEAWDDIERDYQTLMLRCTSRKKVSRIGRRAGKTTVLMIDILHFAFNNARKKILIVCPYKAQTEEIITRIRSALDQNPLLGNCVTKNTSTPYFEIRLTNGTVIRGFTSGSGAADKSSAVRGQDADRIYVDEADYLPANEYKAIMAIAMTNDDVRVWLSSTPSGKRERFYETCVENPRYKEFHFASTVLPQWHLIKDEMRSEYPNDLEWMHEVLAEFGSQEEGVFQGHYVDAAKAEFEYEDIKRNPHWIYSIGVDWNNRAGTEIVVIGYSPQDKIFYVVEARNVSKESWSQLAALEAVVDMNIKWEPRFIYIDEGGGGHIHEELLRKKGEDTFYSTPHHPTARLREIVKVYNFSRKIEIRDPVTKKRTQKDAKHFLVENAVRRFEEKEIKFPKYDVTMDAQLKNFIISRYSNIGKPIYGMNNEATGDHRLDALMLSLIGYKLQLTDFAEPVHTSAVGFVMEFGNHTFKQERTQIPGTLEVTYDCEPSKKAQEKVSRLPEPRYNLPKSLQSRHRTGRNSGWGVRPGWDDDTEHKFTRNRFGSRNKTRRSNI